MAEHSDTQRRRSRARRLVQFSLRGLLVLVAICCVWPANAGEPGEVAEKIALKLANASDPYVWWAWLKGFARGAGDECDEQIVRLRTGIVTLSIGDYFGPPLNVRQRAYVRGNDAGQACIEFVVREIEMQILEVRQPGDRREVERLTSELLEKALGDFFKDVSVRDAKQPPVEPKSDKN